MVESVQIIFAVILFVMLLLVAGMRPIRPTTSRFELQRRVTAGQASEKTNLIRSQQADNIEALLRIVSASVLVGVILLSVAIFGWLIGVFVAIGVALCHEMIARLPFLRHTGNQLYQKLEPRVLAVSQKLSPLLSIIHTSSISEEPDTVSSKEELTHVISHSHDVLSAEERRLLTHTLAFGDQLVSEIMTPRSVIDTVESSELLGPLTLDALHKTGHSRLPVIEGDIDHVVGMLYLQDLLVATSKKTLTAAQAMEAKVFYIREDQTLRHALAAFLRTHHHLFIVVNEYRETVGVISLEDVIERLLGKKITDEFDAHSDLRVVAARNPGANNMPKTHTNV